MNIPESAHNLTCYFTWMGEDGIARTKVKKGSEVKLEHAQENSVVVNSFYTSTKFPLLIDARGIKSMEREARAFFTANGRNTNTLAFGIIIDSSVSKVVGNFFLGINKPVVPTKLFSNEEQAIEWLNKFKAT
ncbi:hypothetical protein [Fluviicola chungangensis]|uniref:DUF7793 domain-containing protein n=1 Tax=Fluviicola chungangensis TaxID=2597671 RepID=A0A556N093_9FLAO|nr:hypothetical protein [Fluviicola chungangensis]TSJ45439.1 hypothetical protein FO442_06705 [Fluviicola chungangensis]